MSQNRFSSFSFVDRIISIEDSGKIRGIFKIPEHLEFFPKSLVAEAIGQLAAWHAMSSINFAYRPVAAIARKIIYHDEVFPGEKLDLFATIESFNLMSVSYSGVALAGKRLLLELNDCLGAMLPQEEFDSPNNVEQHFKLLETIGAKEERLARVPYVLPTNLDSDSKGNIYAILNIPVKADFFADHFPSKNVFPATLLIEALTWMVASQINCNEGNNEGLKMKISSIRMVKVRSWIEPGDQVMLRVEGLTTDYNPKQLKLSANLGGKLVASALLDLGLVSSTPYL